MALKACRECGKSISNKAKKCLHGGIENPSKVAGYAFVLAYLGRFLG